MPSDDLIIKKGFNHGYMLEKHSPELSKKIRESFVDKETPYAQGFRAGAQEWTMEREKTRENSSSLSKYMNRSKDMPSTNTNDKDIEIDR